MTRRGVRRAIEAVIRGLLMALGARLAFARKQAWPRCSMVKVKRLCEKATASDGLRVLARSWPRGIKEQAKIDLWMKDVAPRDELRKVFHHYASGRGF